jgi:hypothetical protein
MMCNEIGICIREDKNMQNLTLVSEKIRSKYNGFKSYLIPSEKITLNEAGLLSTGKNEFLLTSDGFSQFAGLANIPSRFFQTLDPDHQSMIFNRRFSSRLHEDQIPPKLKINLDENSHVLGFDDPSLIHISPVALMETITSSLPKGLSAEKIEVCKMYIGTDMLHISCVSPMNVTEPLPGDIINGGIDILHSISGHTATQISCYLRRLICSNGATAHICQDNTPLRVRRLNNGDFDESDMLRQIHDRFTQAWLQIDEKLASIKKLTEKKRVSLDFLRHERSRFSLNNRMLDAISKALNQDELGPTNTQYDIYNAVSRVATHHQSLTFRQHRTLSRIAGEFSQQEVHKCERCGSWLTIVN